MSSREIVLNIYYHVKKTHLHLFVGQEEQRVFVSLTSFYLSVATTWWTVEKSHAGSERKYETKLHPLLGANVKSLPSGYGCKDWQRINYAMPKIRK